MIQFVYALNAFMILLLVLCPIEFDFAFWSSGIVALLIFSGTLIMSKMGKITFGQLVFNTLVICSLLFSTKIPYLKYFPWFLALCIFFSMLNFMHDQKLSRESLIDEEEFKLESVKDIEQHFVLTIKTPIDGYSSNHIRVLGEKLYAVLSTFADEDQEGKKKINLKIVS